MATRKIKGSWWIDIRFRGRRYRLRSPANYREGAAEYERTVIARLMSGDAVSLPRDAHDQWSRRFSAFSDQWFETYVKTNLEASTQAEYAGVLRRTLVPFFGESRLDTVDPYQVERFKTKRRETGASAKTINNDLFVLSKLLRTAAEWGVIQHPLKIRFLPQDPPETDFLTVSESKRLLEHTFNPMWRLFFFVGLRTGLRAGELIGLRWEDIDLDARIIVVRRNIVDGVVKRPKTRRIRYVAMAWDLCNVLSAVRRSDGYLFAMPGDEPVTRAMAYNALQRACKKAGIRGVGLHVLRHSFASHLVMEGQDLYSVQRLLGHTDPLMTQRYAHLAPSYLRSVVDSLPRSNGGLGELVGQRLGNPWAPNGEPQSNTPQEIAGSSPQESANHNEKRPAVPVSFHGRNDRD